MTIFEVIVLIAIAVFMVYVACGIYGHFHAVFLKRKQVSLLKKERAGKQTRDKLIQELGVQNQAAETGCCAASHASVSTSVALDTTFS